MAVGRAARRAERLARFQEEFGKDAAPRALDLMELLEYAWHDCYRDVTPDDQVIEDLLVCSQGDLTKMIRYCLLAVEDWRDLRVMANGIRAGGQS